MIGTVADPLTSPCAGNTVLSTLSDTLPVGVPTPELTVTVTLPFAPYVIAAGGVIVVVVTAPPTLNWPLAELAAKLPCVAYDATKLWVPRVRLAGLVIVNVAVPAVPFPINVPSVGVPPSTVNDTLPVGMRIPEVTVTVTMPFAPNGIVGALIVVVVSAGFTVKVLVFELAAKLPCAEYDAIKA